MVSKSKSKARDSDADRAAQHFVEELEGWGAPSSEFRPQIDLMCQTPQSAMWIIPAFIAGVGAYLHIWWLHAILHGDAAFPESGSAFREQIAMCRTGLLRAGKAWDAHCLAICTKESVEYTPEGSQLKGALTEAIAGVSTLGPFDPATVSNLGKMTPVVIDVMVKNDPTPLGVATNRLQDALDCLDEDLLAAKSGRSMTHVWKEGWASAA